MKFLTLLSCATIAVAKNILLTNDDGWAATNIRATYYALKNAGHDVLLVAPVSQRSGWSGKFDVPYTSTLLTNGEFDYKVAGDPIFGHEADDDHIWYFNGTPASSMSLGIDYIIPKYFPELNNSIDLVVAGPNEGTNQGGFFSISGTIGATYNSVYRGLPAIAFSGSNGNNSFFKDSLDDDPQNPSNIYANLTVEIVNQLFAAQGDNERALPLGVGLNVNYPPVGNIADNGCVTPDLVYSRLSGLDSPAMKVKVNETTGIPLTVEVDTAALAACLNGICDLPSESEVITRACAASISAFSVDYDANAQLQTGVRDLLAPIIISNKD